MTRSLLIFGAGLLIGASLMLLPLASHVHAAINALRSTDGSEKSGTEAAHTERAFEFIVKLPMEAAAPLFGADKERSWAPGWEPTFFWPADTRDRQGMVFTVNHAKNIAVWIAPVYDLAAGLIQYVYVIPDVMVTLITLKLTPQDKWTHVAVQYERTALNASARDILLQMADHDGRSGPEWEKQVNDYLATLSKSEGSVQSGNIHF